MSRPVEEKPAAHLGTFSLKKLVSGLIIVLLLSLGISRIHISNDPGQYFSDDNSSYQRTLAIEDAFTPNDIVVFILEVDPGQVFTPSTVEVIHALTKELWTQPFVQRVDSLSNFNRTRADQDIIETIPLLDPDINYSAQQLAEIEQYALAHPRVKSMLVDGDASVAIITATLNIERGTGELLQAAHWARALQKSYAAKHPDIQVHLAGTAIFADLFSRVTKQEFSQRVPAIFLVIFFISALLLRSWLLAAATLATILITISSTLGIMGWLAIPLSPAAAFIPIALIAIVLADAIHILSSYRKFLSHLAPMDAMKASLKTNTRPVIMTSLTTSVGFLFLLASDSPPYQHMGLFISVGCIIALLLTLFWLPELAIRLPSSAEQRHPPLQLTRPLYYFLPKGRISLLVVLPLIALALYPLRSIVFNESITENFSKESSVRTTTDIFDQRLSGIHRIDFSFSAKDGIETPQAMITLQKFRSWALAQQEVSSVIAIDQVVSEIYQLFNRHQTTKEALPQSRDMLSQVLLIYELSLPFGMGLDDLMSFDRNSTRIRVMLKSTDSKTLINFTEKANHWFAEQEGHYDIVTGGMDITFAKLNHENSKSIMQGTLAAFFVIAIIMCFILGSLRYGLLSLIPNFLPAIFTYGIWASLGGEISLATSIVACITLGIVVDDTIHLLFHYQANRKEGMSAEKAAGHTLDQCGNALVITTLVLCCAFGLLATSGFKPNADLGILTATTLAIALIADLIFFLPFLVWVDRKASGSA